MLKEYEKYGLKDPKLKLTVLTDIPENSFVGEQLKEKFNVEFFKENQNLNIMDKIFLKADLYYFEKRRYPVTGKKPCKKFSKPLGSLFFQNSLNGYESLHFKTSFSKLMKKVNFGEDESSPILYPRTYDLNHVEDCHAFFNDFKKKGKSLEDFFVKINPKKDKSEEE